MKKKDMQSKVRNKLDTLIIDLPVTASKIGQHSIYEGVLNFKTSLGVLGTVKGEIIGGELLVVFPQAKVEGTIVVDYLLVAGQISGKLHARKGVYFYTHAVVRGTVISALIRMQSGVDFEGECNKIGDEVTDIFSLPVNVYRASIFDKLVHELDSVAFHNK